MYDFTFKKEHMNGNAFVQIGRDVTFSNLTELGKKT